MGLYALQFQYTTQPPGLVDVVQVLRERTELELTANHTANGNDVVIALATGWSIHLHRDDSSIVVEYFPCEWRKYYLAQATLSLLTDLGGAPEHARRAPNWSRRTWREAPKAYFIARWAGNHVLVALWLPFGVLLLIGAALVSLLPKASAR